MALARSVFKWSWVKILSYSTIAQTIKLTENAKLREIKDLGNLRICVDGGGCSGYQYRFELDKNIDLASDKIIQNEDVKVVVDTMSLNFIAGATLDYQEELIKSSFCIIQNPKASTGCSCGASFSFKDELT